MNTYLKKKNYLWQKIVIGLMVLVLFIGVLNMFSQPIKNATYSLTSPFSKGLWAAGGNASGFFTAFSQFQKIKQENDQLQQQNEKLLSQITALQSTVGADQITREFDQNNQDTNLKTVLAATIGLDTSNDFILLDKGSRDGIAQNMPVISQNKVLYGKVVKVYKNFSQVMLISNKSSVVDVKIQSTDPVLPPILGAVKGSGFLSMYLDLIPTQAMLNPGDTLTTSALEGTFPRDLLIGSIISIDKNDVKPFQTAKIQPAFDAGDISSLFIVTDYKQER